MNKTLKTFLISTGALVLAGTVSAALMITDGGFETGTGALGSAPAGNNTADSAAEVRLTNWFELNEDNLGTDGQENEGIEVMEAANGTNNPGVDGYWLNLKTNSGATYNNANDLSGVYQNIGTWNTGDDTQYTFSMDVGDRGNQVFAGFEISLYGGTATTPGDGSNLTGVTLLASAGYQNDADFTWSPATGKRTASYTTSVLDISANVNDSDNIWLYISANSDDGIAGHTLIDNVSVTAIPEPGTLALFGIALGALAIFRRRR